MKQFDARTVAGLLTVPVLLALFAFTNIEGGAPINRTDEVKEMATPVAVAADTLDGTDDMGDPDVGSEVADEFVATQRETSGEDEETQATETDETETDEIEVSEGEPEDEPVAPEDQPADLADEGESSEAASVAEEATETAIDLAKRIAPADDELGYNDKKISVTDDTITLLDDVTADTVWTVTVGEGENAKTQVYSYNGVAIIDLAGHTLDLGKNFLYVSGAGASLSIIDESGEGKIVNDGTQVRVVQASNYATLTINKGVTIEGTKTATVLAANNGEVIIDGGKIINSTTDGALAQQSGVITMNSGVIESVKNGIRALSNSKVNVLDGKISVLGEDPANSNGLYGSTGTVISVSGGEVSSKAGYGVTLFSTSTLKVTGGSFSGMAALTTNGQADTNATVEISGGEFVGKSNTAMYLAGNGVTTISNATITGLTGIMQRGGKLIINSGTIKATAEPGSQLDVGDAGTLVPAGAIIADNITSYNYDSTVINGGTFDGEIAYTNSRESEAKLDAKGKLTVKGGSFSSSLLDTDYLDSDLKVQVERGSDGMNVYYPDLDTAIDEAEPGDIITNTNDNGDKEEPQTLKQITIYNNGIEISTYRTLNGNIVLPEESTLVPPSDRHEFVGWRFSIVTIRDNETQALGLGRGGSEGGTDEDAEDNHSDDPAMEYGSELAVPEDTMSVSLTAEWADKTELRETIESVDDYDETLYTVSSWEALQTALIHAKKVANGKYLQADVNEAEGALTVAIATLERKPAEETEEEAPETPDSGALSVVSDTDRASLNSFWAYVATLSLGGLVAAVLMKRRAAKRNK